MRRRRDLPAALAMALLLHVGLAACAGWCMRTRAPLLPGFDRGESGVQLTLVAAPVFEAVAEPVSPAQVAPVPVRPAEPVLVPPPPEEERVDVLAAPAERQEEVVEHAPPLDADSRDKGVEDASIDNRSVRPRYPLGSRLRGEEGVVQLRVRVNASGRAADVTVVESSGYPALDRAAVKAARRASYATRGGSIEAGEASFGVRFRLEG